MQLTLQTHMNHLRTTIDTLDDRLAGRTLIPAERIRFTAELRAAQLALIHYRLAFELEQQTSRESA